MQARYGKCGMGILILSLGVLSIGWGAEGMSGKAGKSEKGDKSGKEVAKGPRIPFFVPSLATLDKRLGPDFALTEKQRGQIMTLREDLRKKNEELETRPDVQTARDSMKKAAHAKDKEAQKAAQAKLSEALGGFDALERFKQELSQILSQAQMQKAFGGSPEPAKNSSSMEKKEEVREVADSESE